MFRWSYAQTVQEADEAIEKRIKQLEKGTSNVDTLTKCSFGQQKIAKLKHAQFLILEKEEMLSNKIKFFRRMKEFTRSRHINARYLIKASLNIVDELFSSKELTLKEKKTATRLIKAKKLLELEEFMDAKMTILKHLIRRLTTTRNSINDVTSKINLINYNIQTSKKFLDKLTQTKYRDKTELDILLTIIETEKTLIVDTYILPTCYVCGCENCYMHWYNN